MASTTRKNAAAAALGMERIVIVRACSHDHLILSDVLLWFVIDQQWRDVRGGRGRPWGQRGHPSRVVQAQVKHGSTLRRGPLLSSFDFGCKYSAWNVFLVYDSEI